MILYNERGQRSRMANFHAPNGFTLIEILVALVILGITSGVIAVSLSTATDGITSATEQTEALALANSLLASEGNILPLQYGIATGVTADGYRWRIITKPWRNQGDAASQLMGEYWIGVEVIYKNRHLTLSTIRAGPVADANR